MKIKLSIDSYKGVDGSSLTPVRSFQMIQVYEMLEEMGDRMTTYLGIQEEAEKRNLFGKTKAKSAIRTFFPLLKKIGFVNYEGTFPANSCFQNLGIQFVLACRALENVKDDTLNRDEIIYRLQNIKKSAQCEGIINMFNNSEWKHHNMWVALKLLKELKTIHWNEFLYTLHYMEEGKSILEAIEEIKKNKEYIRTLEFVKEDNTPLPDTCYSYIRSYLEEAGLIGRISSMESKLLETSDLLYSQIQL